MHFRELILHLIIMFVEHSTTCTHFLTFSIFTTDVYMACVPSMGRRRLLSSLRGGEAAELNNKNPSLIVHTKRT